MSESTMEAKQHKRQLHPFRRAVIRGLGIVLPPLLTIVIFLWIFNTVQLYLLEPMAIGVRNATALGIMELDPQPPVNADVEDLGNSTYAYQGRNYKSLLNGSYVPMEVYQTVLRDRGDQPLPVTRGGYYRRYVEIEYLQPRFVYPVFTIVFILLLYLLGKFLAAGIGRVFWNLFERGIHRLPLVRNVYSSVKQVTDFLFSETEIEYNRVVAVEYPRKGIWSIALVTGESMLAIRGAAREPVYSVLVPSSPMPVTGYTMTVLQSECVELDITLDQAFQFIISCGVVVPANQMSSPFDDAAGLDTATDEVKRLSTK